MVMLFFVIVFTFFMFASFTVSFRLNTINRVVLNTPKEIFEESIPLLDVNKNEIYFDKNNLYLNLKEYYDNSLNVALPDYQMSLFYFNLQDGSMCTIEKCRGVEVTISGTYIFSFVYSQTISYQIQEGGAY